MLLKLRKTGNYNICEKVSNFEEKVMDTYYERQFKKKDPYIKFGGKTNDRDHDKRKIEDYIAWLETVARRWTVRGPRPPTHSGN